MQRHGADGQSEDDADENGGDVGFVEVLFGVAEHLLDVVHRRRFAHDDHAVADLQYEARRGQQRYAAAVDAADVDPVAVSQPQRS